MFFKKDKTVETVINTADKEIQEKLQAENYSKRLYKQYFWANSSFRWYSARNP